MTKKTARIKEDKEDYESYEATALVRFPKIDDEPDTKIQDLNPLVKLAVDTYKIDPIMGERFLDKIIDRFTKSNPISQSIERFPTRTREKFTFEANINYNKFLSLIIKKPAYYRVLTKLYDCDGKESTDNALIKKIDKLHRENLAKYKKNLEFMGLIKKIFREGSVGACLTEKCIKFIADAKNDKKM